MSILRGVSWAIVIGAILSGWGTGGIPSAFANHPVLVEGNCDSPVPGTTLVSPGTCGDFDGDGRIGTAEDTDGADRVFGTIGAALGPGTGAAAGTGANQNGSVTIVQHGRFAEQLVITGANGNVTLVAAPGIQATIDAVLQGDPMGGNATRQAQSGIVVDAPATSVITLRNLVVRNWQEGIQVLGSSRVSIDDCTIENARDYGIHVAATGTAAITDTEVNGAGFRVGTGVDNTPNPGTGIAFEDTATGIVVDTTVTGSFSTGIANAAGANAVKVRDLRLSDNAVTSTGRLRKLADR